MNKLKYKEDDIKNHCNGCGNDGSWQGKSLIYQLSHVDGMIINMDIKKIHLLCPNCQSQKSL